MKYISCKSIQNEIHFFYDQIRICCSMYTGHVFLDNYQGEKIDWARIKKERKEMVENCKHGNIPDNCRPCYDLEEKDWEDNEKIKRISINHWSHCNCGCKYCVNLYLTKGRITKWQKRSEHYKLLPIIKELIKNDMIGNDIEVITMGGDCGVLDEYESVMNLLYKFRIKENSFMTSGIKYVKAIERSLKECESTNITISLDCGCRETYKKIKRVDKFNEVVKNIKKYIKYSRSNGNELISKYIIVDNLNDNINELEKWLLLSKTIGILNVKLDIDYSKMLRTDYNKQIVPQNIKEMYKYFKHRATELKLNILSSKFVESILSNNSDTYQ